MSTPWQDPDALSLLSAVAAGIPVATSAGNSGPNPMTIGSPSDAPWVAAVGASTHNRLFKNDLVNLTSAGASLPDISGVSLSGGHGPVPIVYAGDYGNPNDPTGDPAQCLQPYPAGTFSGEIVVCDRGAIARVAKGQNVLAGGAGGFVLANLAAQGEYIVADPHFLPAIHIGETNGNALRNWLAANTTAMGEITGAMTDLASANGDNIVSFSSRGPVTHGDYVKPDIVAPGLSIFAATNTELGSTSPEYGLRSGSSLATPHVAGGYLLMRALYPSWTATEIRSAVQTTSSTANLVEDDGSPSTPFGYGSGRIDLSRSAEAGLIMDVSLSDYINADPVLGGNPKTLNLPNLQDSSCINCSWTRYFTNPTPNPVRWTVSTTVPSGLSAAVWPSSFQLSSGQSIAVTITIDSTNATQGIWHFGELRLSSSQPNVSDLHLPIAVKPTSVPTSVSMQDSGAATGNTGVVVSLVTALLLSGSVIAWKRKSVH